MKRYPIKLAAKPAWWHVRLPEIRRQLSTMRHCRIEKLLASKELYAVFFQEKEFPKPEVRWPAAASSANPNAFKTSGIDPQCLMLIAGVHGAEAEGVAAVMNLLQLLETGKDLRGCERPALLSLLRAYRIVVIPCCNPDGRAISPDHLQGVSKEEFPRISQGVWKHGETISWAQSKEFFPLPMDRVAFPGGYPNREGYNIMHDCAPGKVYTREAAAILELTERVQPDLFLNLHSQQGESILGRPSTFDYKRNIIRGRRLSEQVFRALQKHQLPALKPCGNSQSLNLNTAAVMLTGTLAMTYESTTDCGLTFNQILESHYVMLETVLASGQKKIFAPRR